MSRAMNASNEQPHPTPMPANIGFPAKGMRPPAMDRNKIDPAIADAAYFVYASTTYILAGSCERSVSTDLHGPDRSLTDAATTPAAKNPEPKMGTIQ
jgi:hypothetical protein